MTARIRVGSQNMTEGPVTPALRACDVVIGQEIDRKRIEHGLPGKAHYFPVRDPHQSISWDPEVLDVHRQGYLQFHRSGKAEGWRFRTPARGVLFVKGKTVADGAKLVVAGTWPLNSWYPIRPDRDTAKRHAIGLASLALLQARVLAWRAQGYQVIVAGDFNSLRWRGRIKGLRALKNRGLDRAFASRGLELVGVVTEGPKTGVGNDMRHSSVLFTLITR